MRYINNLLINEEVKKQVKEILEQINRVENEIINLNNSLLKYELRRKTLSFFTKIFAIIGVTSFISSPICNLLGFNEDLLFTMEQFSKGSIIIAAIIYIPEVIHETFIDEKQNDLDENLIFKDKLYYKKRLLISLEDEKNLNKKSYFN